MIGINNIEQFGNYELVLCDVASVNNNKSSQIVNWLGEYQNQYGCNIRHRKATPYEISHQPHCAIYINRYDGDLQEFVGGTLFYERLDWLYLDKAFIQPAHRGKKLFSKTIRMLEELVNFKLMSGIFLSTYDYEAPQIYEHFGFTKGCVMPDSPLGNTSIDYYKYMK